MIPRAVHATEWPRYAERLAPHLAAMAAGSCGRYEAGDIADALASGAFRAWVAQDGDAIGCVLLTQDVEYPCFTALRLIGLVGEGLARWVHLLAWLENQARAMGHARIEALHPAAYGGLLRAQGWAEFHVLSEKTL